jgi:hypothetical protein
MILPVANTSRNAYMKRNPEHAMTVNTRRIGGRWSFTLSFSVFRHNVMLLCGAAARVASFKLSSSFSSAVLDSELFDVDDAVLDFAIIVITMCRVNATLGMVDEKVVCCFDERVPLQQHQFSLLVCGSPMG